MTTKCFDDGALECLDDHLSHTGTYISHNKLYKSHDFKLYKDSPSKKETNLEDKIKFNWKTD